MYNLPELSLFKLWVEWDFFEKYFWTQKKFVKKGSGTITTTQRQPMCCCQPQKVCSVYNLPELSLFKLLVEWDFFSSPKVFLKPEKVCEKGKRDNKDGTATTHVLLPSSGHRLPRRRKAKLRRDSQTNVLASKIIWNDRKRPKSLITNREPNKSKLEVEVVWIL